MAAAAAENARATGLRASGGKQCPTAAAAAATAAAVVAAVRRSPSSRRRRLLCLPDSHRRLGLLVDIKYSIDRSPIALSPIDNQNVSTEH